MVALAAPKSVQAFVTMGEPIGRQKGRLREVFQKNPPASWKLGKGRYAAV